MAASNRSATRSFAQTGRGQTHAEGVDAIEVRALTRTFPRRGLPDRRALDDVDLVVPTGQTHGLLGPNGAGKTTFCKILSTVLVPSSGEARLFGADLARHPAAVRPLIGIAFGGERGLYGRLTVEQNLQYWAVLYGLGRRSARVRVASTLETFGLTARARERVEVLSRGWKQRVHLARAVLHEPRLLILDEPTAGLDPVAAAAVRELIAERLPPGCTVLLSTHDMREAEILCDQVTVIGEGRVLVTGRPSELATTAGAARVIRIEEGEQTAAGTRRLLDAVDASVIDVPGGGVELRFGSDAQLRAGIAALLGEGTTSFSVQDASLESYYLDLLGARGIGE